MRIMLLLLGAGLTAGAGEIVLTAEGAVRGALEGETRTFKNLP